VTRSGASVCRLCRGRLQRDRLVGGVHDAAADREELRNILL
jgi:hypothetical protein